MAAAAVAPLALQRCEIGCAAGAMTTPLTLHPVALDAPGLAACCSAITATADSTPFGPADARLELSAGTPRFYVMELQQRSAAAVEKITQHRQVTQCLASADGKPFWIALASPLEDGATIAAARVQLVRVNPGEAIALHRCTWHAGPYFLEPTARFFNLELSDTNITDHHTRPLDRPLRLELH